MSFGMNTDGGCSPNSVFNSWNGLATQRGLETATDKITGAVEKGTQKIVDAVSKVKVKNESVKNMYIPTEYREKLAHTARLAFESLPPDFVSSAPSIAKAIKREGFRDYLERIIKSTQPGDAVMNSTALAESARAILESLPEGFIESGTVGTPHGRQCLKDLCERLVSAEPPEQSEVASKQQAGRAVSYIEVPDATDEMPSGGDPVNDITLFSENDTGINPLFDGYAAGRTLPGTLPVNNVFSAGNTAFGRMVDFS